MKYPIGFAILFSPQLLAGYDQKYISHIYSQICPLPLCIFKERMCCSLHIPSGYFCSKTYMLICTKFISCAQREIKNGGQVPVCFIVVCPELKATCYE